MNHRTLRIGRLIDGTGGTPKLDQAIVVQDGRIQSILPWKESRKSGEFIDLGDATLLPGFIDVHVHLMMDAARGPNFDPVVDTEQALLIRTIGNAQAMLRAGVTTVSDLGALNEIIFPVRDAINEGAIIGPRILASGRVITSEDGHGNQFGRVTRGVEDARQAVTEQVAAGADLIKIMVTGGGGEDPGKSLFTLAELTAMKEEADHLGVWIAAHCHGKEGIYFCVAAGIHRIEHCTFMNLEGSQFDADITADIVRKGIFVCPTNVIDYRQLEQKGGSEEGLAPRSQLNETWRQLYRSGAKIAASSDAGVTLIYHDDYALIWELMVDELGMSPMEAILSGTATAAQALGLENEIGTLTAGKTADMVAVRGNPLDDISAVRKVQMVMRGGQIVC